MSILVFKFKICFVWGPRAGIILWNWSSMRRPYVVFTEGRQDTRYADPAPTWLERGRVYRNLCQCNLLGPRHADWHRYGSMCSNLVRLHHLRFGGFYDGHYCKQRPFPEGCIKNIMNTEIATKLIRLAIYALKDAHPSVPQRGEPLASVLRSRKLNPKVERERLRKHGKWLQRCHIRTVVRGKYSDSEGSSESDGEEFSGSGEYELSSEESVA